MRIGLAAAAMACAVSTAAEVHYREYALQSANQAYASSIRVLVPDTPQGMARYKKNPRVVYVLPVNPDISLRWGDGISAFLAAGLHNRYGVTAVAPSFSAWPWYADHPTDPKLRQETFFVSEVVPFVDRLFPEASRRRLLVGFSKSGNGAVTLLLRHPDLFYAAASWDAPLMKEAPDQFGMAEVYGTQENFDSYAIPGLLKRSAARLRGNRPRLALLGYGSFSEHTQKTHEFLDALGIPHLYDNRTRREHRWDSGWLDPALQALDEMSR
jgi:putative esterase